MTGDREERESGEPRQSYASPRSFPPVRMMGAGAMDRAREPIKQPADNRHDAMEFSDGMARFCAKCGRVIAYRAFRNTPWFSTEAGNRSCDWGG
jgi:hypothetical protein